MVSYLHEGKCQEVTTVLQTCNIFFVTHVEGKKTLKAFEFKNRTNSLILKTQARGLTGSAEGRMAKRERQVDKLIINDVNAGGVQRFCSLREARAWRQTINNLLP